MDLPVTKLRRIVQFNGEVMVDREDEVATEYALTVFVNEQEMATLVCTPTEMEELAVGFLASEGVIRSYDEIRELSIDENQGFAYVKTSRDITFNQQFYNKRYITSCCGKSRQSFYFYNDAQTAKPIEGGATLPVSAAFRLMTDMQELSDAFRNTGGVHNAALCDQDGVIVARTDIGRHNALDKIYGHCLQHGIPTHDKFIAFSGRISSEVVLKAAKIGTGILLSKSAPTELALDMADELGITAVGFIRGSRLNVYTHPERIAADS